MAMTIQELLELNGYDMDDLDNSLQIDGYDNACIGISENGELVYDYALLVRETMKDGCTYEEAMEFVDYNIVCAKFSDAVNPVIVNLFMKGEEDEQ